MATGPVFSSESTQYVPSYVSSEGANRFSFRNDVLFRKYETIDKTRNLGVAREMYRQDPLELFSSSFSWLRKRRLADRL